MPQHCHTPTCPLPGRAWPPARVPWGPGAGPGPESWPTVKFRRAHGRSARVSSRRAAAKQRKHDSN
eukprot:893952-Alexandrium_andersonii.AAC.1